MLAEPEPPTAMLYDNDVMDVAVLSACQEDGLRVPDDLSIVAWDDSPLCRIVHPGLTALGRDIAGYGGHVVRRLLEVVDGQQVGPFEDSTPHLTVRGSTASPCRR